MKRQSTILIIALALGFVACAKEEAKTEEATDKPKAAAVKPTAAKEVKVADKAIPAEEDFEEEAERTINEANLEEEVDKLAKEIESE